MAATTGDYELGPDRGQVLVKTTRVGLAAKAGHDLTLEVTRWSARVSVPADGAAAATVSAELDLGSLEVRSGSGGLKPLSDGDRRDITKTMRKVLGNATAATFTSARTVPSGGGGAVTGGAVEGTVSLGGKSAPARLQVTSPGGDRYRGTATITQSALGIKPYVGFFGALKVSDDVTVEFEVDLSGG